MNDEIPEWLRNDPTRHAAAVALVSNWWDKMGVEERAAITMPPGFYDPNYLIQKRAEYLHELYRSGVAFSVNVRWAPIDGATIITVEDFHSQTVT